MQTPDQRISIQIDLIADELAIIEGKLADLITDVLRLAQRAKEIQKEMEQNV